jgi:AraC-like DNA-binding protein
VAGGVEKDLQRMHQSQIRQRAQNIDDQLSYLEIGISHWAFDAVFDKRLKEIDFAQGYEQVRQLYDTLLVMESSHSLISRVELYLREPRPFRMTSLQYGFLDPVEAEILYGKLEQPAKGMYWSDALAGGQLKLVNRLPGISEENLGYLVTTLDSARLNNLLETLTPYNEGATFLLKSDGSWLAPGQQSPAGLEEAVRREFLQRGGLPGSFTMKAGDTLYSVYAGSLKRPGGAWTYVSAAPMSSVMAPVLRLSRIIAGISLAGLLLAFLLSWLGSLRLYSPVGRMERESESIRRRLEEQLPLLRESFLLQLSQGGLLALTEEQLRERLSELGRETGGQLAVLLLLRVRRSPAAPALAGQGAMAGFAAAECGRDWLKQHGLNGDVLNLHDMSAAILLWAPPAGSTGGIDRQRLLSMGGELLRSASERLGLRVTLVISRAVSEAGQIVHLFEEARQSADNRMLSADSVLIDLEQPQEGGSPDTAVLRYPFAREKEVVYALRSGRKEEACSHIASFLEELCQEGGTERELLQGMQQLYGSLRHAMLQVGIQLPREAEGGSPYLELAALEETGQMLEWFRTRVVEPYTGLLESRREEEEGRLVQDMIRQVHDRYGEQLSLDEFAEEAGANAYTVSRMFKQATGVNYIDYLTKVRLEKAKELLAGTDMRINVIAEQVGYQATYFNRIFKKMEGITPGAYRESAVSPESQWGESPQGRHSQ